jgi:hypothetical protein
MRAVRKGKGRRPFPLPDKAGPHRDRRNFWKASSNKRRTKGKREKEEMGKGHRGDRTYPINCGTGGEDYRPVLTTSFRAHKAFQCRRELLVIDEFRMK